METAKDIAAQTSVSPHSRCGHRHTGTTAARSGARSYIRWIIGWAKRTTFVSVKTAISTA
jgi:hypothetical protein